MQVNVSSDRVAEQNESNLATDLSTFNKTGFRAIRARSIINDTIPKKIYDTYICIRYIQYIRANDSSAPTKNAQCQGRAKLLMKLFYLNKSNFACLMIVL